MKKLVIKTASITLASIILFVGVLFGALAIFTPKTLGKFFDGMGGEDTAIFFYEKQYNKKQRNEDLFVLVDKLNAYDDEEKTYKYSKILIENVEFSSLSDAEFYYGKFAVSAVECGKIEDGLKKSVQFIKDNGYTTHNPLRTIIFDSELDFNLNDVLTLISAHDALSVCVKEGELENYISDGEVLMLMLQNKTNPAE